MTKIRSLPDGRHVTREEDGRLVFRNSEGEPLQVLIRHSGTYMQLGLSMEDCVVWQPGEPGQRTLWLPSGFAAFQRMDCAKYNPADPTTINDPYAVMWIGDVRVRAYGTREQSNFVKYGAEKPSNEAIESGTVINEEKVTPPASAWEQMLAAFKRMFGIQ